MNLSKDMGGVIKHLRLMLGLEQHEFATLLGVVSGTVWNWEHNHRRPRLPKIRKMLEIARENKIKLTIKDFLA